MPETEKKRGDTKPEAESSATMFAQLGRARLVSIGGMDVKLHTRTLGCECRDSRPLQIL
jgi:hypothetical protein